MKKIAFCFLLYDKIEHDKLWINFFKGYEEYFNIYSHPKSITKNTPDFIKNSKIKKIINTEWCSDSLMFAPLLMVKEALKDPDNKYFCIISGACLPLFSFPVLYKKLFRHSQARIYFPKRRTLVFKNESKKIHPHYQNVILNVPVAKQFVRLGNKKDRTAQKYLKWIRGLYKKHRKNDTWVEWCEDEVFLGQWLIHVYGGFRSKRFNNQIISVQSTYAEFKPGADHPIIFSKQMLTTKKLNQIKRESFFGRKFKKSGAEYIASKTKPPFNT